MKALRHVLRRLVGRLYDALSDPPRPPEPTPSVPECLQARLAHQEYREAEHAARLAYLTAKLEEQRARFARMDAEEAARARAILVVDEDPLVHRYRRATDEQRQRWQAGAS